ncbi:hypothetical protein VP01_4369g1, partial [Puccinia sorghi]
HSCFSAGLRRKRNRKWPQCCYQRTLHRIDERKLKARNTSPVHIRSHNFSTEQPEHLNKMRKFDDMWVKRGVVVENRRRQIGWLERPHKFLPSSHSAPTNGRQGKQELTNSNVAVIYINYNTSQISVKFVKEFTDIRRGHGRIHDLNTITSRHTTQLLQSGGIYQALAFIAYFISPHLIESDIMLLSKKFHATRLSLFVLGTCLFFKKAVGIISCGICRSSAYIQTSPIQIPCTDGRSCGIHTCGAFRDATHYVCNKNECGEWKGYNEYVGDCNNHVSTCACQENWRGSKPKFFLLPRFLKFSSSEVTSHANLSTCGYESCIHATHHELKPLMGPNEEYKSFFIPEGKRGVLKSLTLPDGSPLISLWNELITFPGAIS